MLSKSVLFFFLFVFSFSSYSQSPWVNKKGSFYGQVSATYLAYGSVINEEVNELVKANFRTTDLTVSLFTEYSLSNRLSVLASLPYKSVQYANQSLSSLGDPTAKLKYQILKDIPLSAYVGYMAPLSIREGVLRTGYNQHAAELGVSIGRGKAKSFIYGGLGYRYRANIPDQALVEFEYGYRFLVAKKPMYLIVHVDGALRTSIMADPEAGEPNLYHNNGEFLSPALKLSYNAIDDFWVNVGMHSAVFVRNYGASSTFNLGLAYKLLR